MEPRDLLVRMSRSCQGARPQYDANAAVDGDEGDVPKHYQMQHLSRREKVCEVVMHIRSLATSDLVLGDQSQPCTSDYCVLLCIFFYQELMLSMVSSTLSCGAWRDILGTAKQVE